MIEFRFAFDIGARVHHVSCRWPQGTVTAMTNFTATVAYDNGVTMDQSIGVLKLWEPLWEPVWSVRYEYLGDEYTIIVPGNDEEDARGVAELRLSAADIFGATIVACTERR